MNLQKRNYLTTLVYFQSFILGLCIYIISIVSVVKLLNHVSLAFYPLVVFIQGFIVLISTSLLSTLIVKREKIFHQGSLIIGILTVGLSFVQTTNQQLELTLTSMIFFFSMISVMWIETSMNHMQTTKTSILSNPHVSVEVSLVHELAIIFASVSGIFIKFFALSNFVRGLIFFTPLILAAILFLIIFKDIVRPKEEIKKGNIKYKDLLAEYPFIPWLILLFIILMSAKNLHAFTQMLGMKAMSTLEGSPISKIFSKISIIQSTMIILFLLMVRIVGEKSSSWIKGVRYFLGGQIILMASMSFFPGPIILTGSGALRKLLHRSVLNNSISLLFSSIPSIHRLLISNLTTNLATMVSFFVVALFSLAHLVFHVPLAPMLFIITLLICLSFLVTKKLLLELNSFNVKYITKFHKANVSMNDATNACLALSNPQAREHFAALSILLWWRPRPALTKAIIYSLGKMHVEENIKTLIDCFNKFDSVNVQKQTALALSEYKTPLVKHFLLSTCFSLVLAEGNLKKSLICTIVKILPHEMLALLNTQLLSKNLQPRFIPKILEALSCFTCKNCIKKIIFITLPFLDCNFNIDIQLAACSVLYPIKQYRKKIYDCLTKYMAPSFESDYIKICNFIGNMEIYEYKNFVINAKDHIQPKNYSEYLVCLISLGIPFSYKLFLDELFDSFGGMKMDAIAHIKKFYRVKNSIYRYQFYSLIVNQYPSRIEKLLDILALSDMDFDEDRNLIIKQSIASGFDLVDDFQLFKKSQKSPSKA